MTDWFPVVFQAPVWSHPPHRDLSSGLPPFGAAGAKPSLSRRFHRSREGWTVGQRPIYRRELSGTVGHIRELVTPDETRIGSTVLIDPELLWEWAVKYANIVDKPAWREWPNAPDTSDDN